MEVDVKEEKIRLLQLLYQHDGWSETLSEALEVERKRTAEFKDKGWGEFFGWEWHEVHTPIVTLHKMVTEKIIDVKVSTRSGTHFMVRNPELLKEVLSSLEGVSPEQMVQEAMPTDLFNIIVGHNDVKDVVRLALEARKPVHMLYHGPPASAKTLFLMELSRLPDSYYCLAQTSSQSGLANVLFTFQPKYLLIDEIDRLDGNHVGVLNSLMSTGIVSETKHGKTRRMDLSTKVFAAGIKVNVLPGDLLSRFIQVKFLPYGEKEFSEVVVRVLTSKEGVSELLASFIASEVWKRSQLSSDVRQCVQIARLCNGEMDKVKDILKIWRK